MRFTQALFAGAALIAATFAVEINSLEPTNPKAGSSATIKYSPKGNTPTTFILSKGESEALTNISTLTTSATGGTFVWNVDSSLPNGKDYALRIVQEGSPTNFWGPFEISGGKDAVSSASSSASASMTSSASMSSVSGSASVTASRNSTVASATLSTSATGTASGRPTGSSGSPTSSGNGVPNSTGAAVALGSKPFALIAGVVGAIAYIQ